MDHENKEREKAQQQWKRKVGSVGHRGRHRDEFIKSEEDDEEEATSALKNRLSNCGFPSLAATHFDPNERAADPDHWD